MGDRNHYVDSLRGISILMIMLLHALVLTDVSYSKYMQLLIDRLSLGVPFFFIISGYVISLNYDRSVQSKFGLARYFVNRAAKILPLYYIFLLLWWVVIKHFDGSIMPQNTVSEDFLTLNNYLMHVFFLQGFAPENLNSLLDGDWSIVNEVYFYILFPFIAPLVKNNTRVALYLLLASYLVVILLLILVVLGDTQIPFPLYYTFPVHLPEFVLGMVAFRVLQNGKIKAAARQYSSLILVFVSVFVIGFVDMSSALLGSHHLFSILFFIVLIVAGSQYNNSSPMLLYFSTLGKQSYSLYFTHLLLLKLTFVICTNYYSVSGYFLLLLNFVLILPLSLIMSNFVFNKIDIYFVGKAKAFYQSKVKI